MKTETLSENTFVYRIISLDRLYELFETQQNVLVSPEKWEDPWENFILKAPVETASGERGAFAFVSDFYGQCWTLHTASDAMWRIYSPERNAVRIRTTAGKLKSSLASHLGEWAHATCFMQKVNYLNERQLYYFVRSLENGPLNDKAFASTLFVKRRAFVHEKEIRLVYLEKDHVRRACGLFRYHVNSHHLVDQIMVDPRMSAIDARIAIQKIARRTGYKGQIKRSLLYAPPKGIVFRLP